MSVFYIGTYNIVNLSEFQKYPPIVLSLCPSTAGWCWHPTQQLLLWKGRRAR